MAYARGSLAAVIAAAFSALVAGCAVGSNTGPGGAGGTVGGAGTTGSGTAGTVGSAGTGGSAGSAGGGTTSAGGTTGAGGTTAGTGGATAGTSGGGLVGTAGTGGATAGTTGGGGAGAGTTGGGGTTGAGGTASGRGGSSGGGAAGTGSGGAGAAAFLSTDFESEMTGKQPAGWDNFVAWVKNNTNPSGQTMAVVDTTRAHSGTKSVHFRSAGNPAMITKPLPTGTNKLYVRAWFYMTRKLGMNPGANHETLIGIRKTSGMADNEVRFGEIKGVIGTNEVPTDNIVPKMAQWGLGPVIPANQWNCIEVAFIADQAQHTLQAWAGGTMVHSVTAGDQWQNGTMPANWMNGKFVEVILGWHTFSSADNEVWMDDLVLSTAPIGGCN